MAGCDSFARTPAACLETSTETLVIVAPQALRCPDWVSCDMKARPVEGRGQGERVVAFEFRDLMARQQSHITSLTEAARRRKGET